MMKDGTWNGGYVNGVYVMPELDVIGSERTGNGGPSNGSTGNGETGNGETGNGGAGSDSTGNGSGGSTGGSGNESAQIYKESKAVQYLEQHAYPHYIPDLCGHCAKAVRLAIEAGGLSTEGHPRYACDYDTFLPNIGFRAVSKEGYVPRAGDIIVLEAVPGHQAGHIAMYSGEKWISDFVQGDMWGGGAYRNKAEYTIFRKY